MPRSPTRIDERLLNDPRGAPLGLRNKEPHVDLPAAKVGEQFNTGYVVADAPDSGCSYTEVGQDREHVAARPTSAAPLKRRVLVESGSDYVEGDKPGSHTPHRDTCSTRHSTPLQARGRTTWPAVRRPG
ncbi:MAG TPA: hypothetical protein VN812_01975, partial [Candidatus Acidoferrales bacterium]|nr:hypothetical protein [Candidatus Acidoferrales bacterium]